MGVMASCQQRDKGTKMPFWTIHAYRIFLPTTIYYLSDSFQQIYNFLMFCFPETIYVLEWTQRDKHRVLIKQKLRNTMVLPEKIDEHSGFFPRFFSVFSRRLDVSDLLRCPWRSTRRTSGRSWQSPVPSTRGAFRKVVLGVEGVLLMLFRVISFFFGLIERCLSLKKQASSANSSVAWEKRWLLCVQKM